MSKITNGGLDHYGKV